MHKKAIMKKACGKGGLVKDTIKEIPGTLRGMGKNLYKAVDPAGLVVGGIKKFKKFKAADDELNRRAAEIQGKVSSNEANVNEFIRIKNKLKKGR